MRFSFYNRDAAGEHREVIAEVQHKQSIMFLAERTGESLMLFQFFQNAQRVSHHGGSGGVLGLPARH